ncbi:unnamed protein product [Penicillium manginii]
MTSDKVKVFTKAFGFFIPYLGRTALQRVAAVGHRWSWQNTPDAKNVVVLGGSFAGIELVKRLSETLPTGYKAIWIEKNSHLNFSFNFPRYSVLEGHEHAAFIPYDGIAKNAPAGIFTRIQDKAIGVTENNQIQLASGDNIDFEYLAIATGSSQPLPVQVTSTERNKGCHELQGVQKTIKASQKIAIIGGGAVGVEIASDIKDFYPDKEVTLVHSRGQLLNNFGKRFGDYTLNALRDELQIRVLLNERPAIPGNFARGAALKFSDGHEEQFDLVIGCTGQRPNSSVLAAAYPNTLAKNSRILVRSTLQVFDSTDAKKDLPMFAFGDVADHPGPRMARAGLMQSEVVLDNILAKINGQPANRTYTPNWFVEGAIKLTLGKKHEVTYAMDNDGSDIMMPDRNGKLDLEIESAWKRYGVDFKEVRKGKTEAEPEVQVPAAVQV